MTWPEAVRGALSQFAYAQAAGKREKPVRPQVLALEVQREISLVEVSLQVQGHRRTVLDLPHVDGAALPDELDRLGPVLTRELLKDATDRCIRCGEAAVQRPLRAQRGGEEKPPGTLPGDIAAQGDGDGLRLRLHLEEEVLQVER